MSEVRVIGSCRVALATLLFAAATAGCDGGKKTGITAAPKEAGDIARTAAKFLQASSTGDRQGICATAAPELVTVLGGDDAAARCETTVIEPFSELLTVKPVGAVAVEQPSLVTVGDGPGSGVIFLGSRDELAGSVPVQLAEDGGGAPAAGLEQLSQDTRPAVAAVGRFLRGVGLGNSAQACSTTSDADAFSVLETTYHSDIYDKDLPAETPTCRDLIDGAYRQYKRNHDSEDALKTAVLSGYSEPDALARVDLLRTAAPPEGQFERDSPDWIGSQLWLVKRDGQWRVLGFSRARSGDGTGFNLGS